MSSFKHKFPHKVEKISPINEDDPKNICPSDYYYRREEYVTYSTEITIDYCDYRRLEDYVDDKIKIDDFLQKNKSARKLYDQIMVLYHLTR